MRAPSRTTPSLISRWLKLEWEGASGESPLSQGTIGIAFETTSGKPGNEHIVTRNVFANVGIGIANATGDYPMAEASIASAFIQTTSFTTRRRPPGSLGDMGAGNQSFESWDEADDFNHPSSVEEVMAPPSEDSQLYEANTDGDLSYGAPQGGCSWTPHDAGTDPGTTVPPQGDTVCAEYLGASECEPYDVEEAMTSPWCVFVDPDTSRSMQSTQAIQERHR